MALIGNAFSDYVKEQIKKRQNILGQGLSSQNPRTLNIQKALNSNAPWIRLSSAINITEGNAKIAGDSVLDIIKQSGRFEGFEYEGDALSKNFVLMSTPTNNKGNIQPSGVINGDNALTKAYGLGYTKLDAYKGRGYVPPPGIISANFEYKNDGALAFATVNIKAFSEVQFSIIDILFQRPGYTCLLEFGHTMYIDNDGELKRAGQDKSFNTKPFEFIYKSKGKDVNYLNLAKKISEEKEDWDGNYEGFFGRITKFNWKFNADGSYDITVKLVGTGDVISSLNSITPKLKLSLPLCYKQGEVYEIPVPSDKSIIFDSEIEEAEEEGGIVIADALKSQLNFELYSIFKDTKTFPSQTDSPDYLSSSSSVATSLIENTSDPITGAVVNIIKPAVNYIANKFIDSTAGSKKDFAVSNITLKDIPIHNELKSFTIKSGVVKADVNDYFGSIDYSPLTFIKFGVFLSIMQKVCNIKDNQNNHMLNFNMVESISKLDPKEDTTYIVTYPGNFSSNPTQCLIKYDQFEKNITSVRLPTSRLNDFYLHKTVEKIENLENSKLSMRLSDVYLDINFISKVLRDLRGNEKESDSEVEIPILDLLNSILSGVNTSLGGLNNFRVIFDEPTNSINIISESPILNTAPKQQEYSIINTFGLTKDQGSFVIDMDLNSELTDQMATQITIGAQANSSTFNGSATTFSTYSKGLVDRMFVEKKTSYDNSEDGQTYDKELPKDKIVEALNEDVLDALQQVYNDGEFGDKYIPVLENVVSSVSHLTISRYVQKSESPVPFFLPFNLGLTMHGIGGMKIYQGFQIEGKGLPLNYNPKNINLIIKSLSHTINVDGWKTKIETISKPLTEVNSNKSNNLNIPNNSLEYSGINPNSFKAFFAPMMNGSTTNSPFTTQPPLAPNNGNNQSVKPPTNKDDITGEFNIDLTGTINSPSRKKIIEKFGWPITIENRGGKIYGKKIGENNGRVVYELSKDYYNRNVKTFRYIFQNASPYKELNKKIHQGIHEPLRKTLEAIDKAGFADGVGSIDATIYARDTTNNLGVLSGHSFGVAMDFNASKYGYGNTAFKQYQEDLKNRNSPNHKFAKAIEIAKNTGLWSWGGDYSRTKDTHHFTFKPYTT